MSLVLVVWRGIVASTSPADTISPFRTIKRACDGMWYVRRTCRLVSLAASVYAGAVLNPTPPEALTDSHGRPYFLWDCDLTVAEFEERLRDPDRAVQGYFVAKLMRQAKPDDVFRFVTLAKIRTLWPTLVPHLGHARPFWSWLLETWANR